MGVPTSAGPPAITRLSALTGAAGLKRHRRQTRGIDDMRCRDPTQDIGREGLEQDDDRFSSFPSNSSKEQVPSLL